MLAVFRCSYLFRVDVFAAAVFVVAAASGDAVATSPATCFSFLVRHQ